MTLRFTLFHFLAYGVIAMHLFIDTNVFLSFFHYSSEGLEELHKLAALMRTREVTLYLPEQVKDEFYRNRDGKIADALRQFTDEKLTTNFPQICKEYEEYSELRKLIDAYKKTKDALLKKIREDFKQERFKADVVIRELFSAADNIKVSEGIFNKAKRRYELGNPPGKKDSLGDAINWECLLEAVPAETDLYFIANDGDYFSKTNDRNFSHFLVKEWAKNKASQIILYRRLSDFFKERFPEIKLADDYERDFWIKSLQPSHNFAAMNKDLQEEELHETDSVTLRSGVSDGRVICNVCSNGKAHDREQVVLIPKGEKYYRRDDVVRMAWCATHKDDEPHMSDFTFWHELDSLE